MPSKLNAFLLPALVAVLLRCAPGAPVADEPEDNSVGDTSGEEGETRCDLLDLWDSTIGAVNRCRTELEGELQIQVKYHHLRNYRISSLPADCPRSNFSKEACLQRLAEGLQSYMVFLRHVQREYPNTQSLSEVGFFCNLLTSRIKNKMKHSERVVALTSSQEEQLLRENDNANTFYRRMIAHRILHELYYFLVDGRRSVIRKEKVRHPANSNVAAVSFYHQH